MWCQHAKLQANNSNNVSHYRHIIILHCTSVIAVNIHMNVCTPDLSVAQDMAIATAATHIFFQGYHESLTMDTPFVTKKQQQPENCRTKMTTLESW